MPCYFDLPEDIIFNILSRVPARSVGLCRCVSKQWRMILSQPDFIKLHVEISKVNSSESLIIFGYASPQSRWIKHERLFYTAPLNNSLTLSLAKLDLMTRYQRYNICGSCNGLVFFRDKSLTLTVINPLTRQIRKVPPYPFGFGLKLCVFGLGYDSIQDDYKIVVISYSTFLLDYIKFKRTNVDIFSLKIGSWKRREASSHCVDSRTSERAGIRSGVRGGVGIAVRGCLHWFHNNVVVSFNFVDEKLREFQLPSLILHDSHPASYHLDALGDFLCIYSIKNSEVWLMKEYSVLESWTKFTMNIPRCPQFNCLFLTCQEQVATEISNGHYAMWNLKDGTSKEIVFRFDDGSYNVPVVEASFIESLVSPYGS